MMIDKNNSPLRSPSIPRPLSPTQAMGKGSQTAFVVGVVACPTLGPLGPLGKKGGSGANKMFAA
jgi:hypothetical protein